MSYILETFQEVIWNYQEHFWRKNLPVRDIPQIFLFRNNFWGHYLVGENVKKYENIGHLVKQSHFFIIVHKLGQTVPFWGRFQLQKLWKSRKEWDYSSKSTWPFLKYTFVQKQSKSQRNRSLNQVYERAFIETFNGNCYIGNQLLKPIIFWNWSGLKWHFGNFRTNEITVYWKKTIIDKSWRA